MKELGAIIENFRFDFKRTLAVSDVYEVQKQMKAENKDSIINTHLNGVFCDNMTYQINDPEEIDSRFAKLDSVLQNLEHKKQYSFDKLEGADDASAENKSKVRLFSFSSLDSVIHACQLLKNLYQGANTLYKDTPNNLYILALTISDHSTSDFNKICNMLSEYGSAEKVNGAVLAFLEEHCEIIVSTDAVKQLGNL